MTQELERTALYDLHKALGARLVPFAGWEMPVQYSGVKEEHLATRSHAGLFDVSHMGQLEVRGPGALDLVNRLITNDLARLSDGQALYTCCCNDKGLLLDDLIVYRLQEGHILVVCNASNHEKIREHFRQQLSGTAVTLSSHPERALLAVQGPQALNLVANLLAAPVASQVAAFHSKTYPLDLAKLGLGQTKSELRVARTGYTGEDGVELFCENGVASALFQKLIELGAKPCGLAARDTLRLEACLRLYGHELDETTNPLEAGLGWTVKLDKQDFMGKAALQELARRGSTRKLVGFQMNGRGIARAGYPLLSLDGSPVGVCTSGAPSPTTGLNIGLGYLPVDAAEVGTEFLVDCRGKSIPAQVVTTPFYRRPKVA